VNINKPHDIAVVAQLVLALGLEELIVVGTTLDPTHSKVVAKLASWNIGVDARSNLPWRRVNSLQDLADQQHRLVATSPTGGVPLPKFDYTANDVFVLGGAAGLSQTNLSMCDVRLTIPCNDGVPFLTVAGVVPLLVGYLLF
jgi:tRNA G18 (ribose-2'-O)-methylase SpoU